MSPLIPHLASALRTRWGRLPAEASRLRSLVSSLRRSPLVRSLLRAKPARAPAFVSATLPAGQATRLMLRRGETLLVREGRLWLTREGDPVDHVLWPGAGHVASVPQEVVIEAFGPHSCRYERHRLSGP